jgi:hypothetical protein
MNKTVWLLLTLVALPLHAQSILSTLNQYQGNLGPGPSTVSGGSPEIRTPESTSRIESVSSSASTGTCEENEQTSLPLSYVTSLIQARQGQLEVSYDSRRGRLTVSAPDMIRNCESMMKWEMKVKTEAGQPKLYAIEAKIKTGDNCTPEGCEYRFAKVEAGTFRGWQTTRLKPNLSGFEECLKQAGVIENGHVKTDALFTGPLNQPFEGITESGDVQFVSHGPVGQMVRAKHAFRSQDRCDYFESINPTFTRVVSTRDQENARLQAEVAELRRCRPAEYARVADFMERYENMAGLLTDIRDDLIEKAAKDATKRIEEGRYTEDDLKVIQDFERYMVNPLIQRAGRLYEELRDLTGAEQTAKRNELKVVLDKLKEYNTRPYLTAALTRKLIADGRFDEAEKMNGLKITLDTYSKLGTRVNGAVVTPESASTIVLRSKESFHRELETERENYSIRTGETRGRSNHYRDLSRTLRNNIEIRTRNFTAELQDEFGRVQQPNGHCYRYFRNTQRCIQDSMTRIQELQNLLRQYNRVDSERAAEYDEKARQYGEMEAQGRRHVAAQNGEELPPERPVAAQDNTIPARRQNEGGYNFDYQGGQPQQNMVGNFQNMVGQWGQQQQMMNPNPYPMYGQNMNGMYGGYGNYGMQQPPFMGQQAFGMNPTYNIAGGYNFQYGGGGQQQPMGGYNPSPYGQPGYGYGPQGGPGGAPAGYWGQPYSAFGMPSFYR